VHDSKSETVKDEYEKIRAGVRYENSSYSSFQENGQTIGTDPNDFTIVFYPEWGLTETVKLVKGKREGSSRIHDTWGLLWIERNYKNGKKTGTSISYGALYPPHILIEANFKNGKKDGVEKKYYDSGKLEEINIYKEGLLHGDRLIFHENGVLYSETRFENGKQSPEGKAYSNKGKLTYESFIDQKTGQRVVRDYYKITGNISEEEIYNTKGECTYRKLFSEDGSWHRAYNPSKELKDHTARVRRIKESFEKKDIPIPIEDVEYDVISTIVLHHMNNSYLKEKNIETAIIYPKSDNTHLLGQGLVCELPAYALTGDSATLKDFIKKNLKSYKFENKFKGSNAIDLVADDVITYPNAISTFRFSRVGLNVDRTEAVVFFQLWGRGHLIFVKKNDHKWQVIKTERINIIQI
jgi:antitoxin component YwqK of YwqJK toxin-antitoxin module